MGGYALDELVVEVGEDHEGSREMRLIGATGIVPNSSSVMPMRKQLARMLGTHPRKVVVPAKKSTTGSVTLLRAPKPSYLSDEEAQKLLWECVALQGDKLEPLVTPKKEHRSKRRRDFKKSHQTPLPRLTGLAPSCGFH